MATNIRKNRHLHPDRAELVAWLEGAESRLDEHIESCLVCADQIEAIEFEDGVASEEENSPIAVALAATSAPPVDLKPRLAQAISKTLQSRQDFALFGDLFGISWRTVRIMTQGKGLHE